jgi:hypothetical protein
MLCNEKCAGPVLVPVLAFGLKNKSLLKSGVGLQGINSLKVRLDIIHINQSKLQKDKIP